MGSHGVSTVQVAQTAPPATTGSYPSHQPANKRVDYPLGRAILALDAISRRLSDAAIPMALLRELPGFRLAAIRQGGENVLDVADLLQTLVAIGTHCALHGTELTGNDVEGRHCTACEFGFAVTRYRGHAPIDLVPMGEVFIADAPRQAVCGWCGDSILAPEDEVCSESCGRALAGADL